MVVKFVKNSSQTDILLKVRNRALTYNSVISEITGSKTRISVPVKDLRKMLGKFNSVKEYIESDKKWIKLRDFDDSRYSFKSYIQTLMKNWPELILILNNPKIPEIPVFNLVVSQKLEKLYWQFTEKEKRSNQKNLYRVSKSTSDSIIPSIDVDRDSFLRYATENPNMSVDDILLTFRRDIHPEFASIVRNLEKQGYSRERIISHFLPF